MLAIVADVQRDFVLIHTEQDQVHKILQVDEQYETFKTLYETGEYFEFDENRQMIVNSLVKPGELDDFSVPEDFLND